ncbi:hypothetical protein N9B57_02405, partial [Verrucomicrobia bacterium]|nr:hypothetical protein [Verrucomicrobiota bacterium]MDA7866765.1 hypothetical protein [Verrucomicrobiota bacterium]
FQTKLVYCAWREWFCWGFIQSFIVVGMLIGLTIRWEGYYMSCSGVGYSILSFRKELPRE